MQLFAPRVPVAKKIFFVENLRVMLRAGISLAPALQTLSSEIDPKSFARVIQGVADRLERGESFGEALTRYPSVFPEIFVNMVKVGEVSGTLERSLEQLGGQMKKEATLKSKVRGALIYPAVVLTATVVIGFLMMIFVVPQILSIFNEVQVELPLSTRILIAASGFVSKNAVGVTIAALLAVGALIFWSRRPSGKLFLHTIFLNFPIMGGIIRKVELARFTRTLSALIKTDVPVVEALRITSSILGNIHYRNAVAHAGEELKKGIAIAEALKKHPKLFPAMVTHITAVGEQSGAIDTLLDELATFYEADVEQILANLTQIIEPLLIVVLGIAVGWMAIAVISPIYKLSESI